MFRKLFGAPQPTTAPAAQPAQRSTTAAATTTSKNAPTKAVQQMNETIETLELREQLLIKKIDAEVRKAKEAMEKKNKSLALLCMKRKKLYEQTLERLMAQRGNMETIKITMEDTALTHQVLQSQRVAATELERLNAQMNAERVEEDVDKLRELMEQQKEVQELLTQPIDSDPVDEDELMEELNRMTAAEQKVPSAKVSTTKAVVTLPDMGPSVPSVAISGKPKAVEEDEDDELARLEAEMNAAAA